MRQAVFLDRDGVINEEVNYLSEPDQLRLIPGAREAIARLNETGLPVIVITNQAGVARGYYPEAQIEVVHAALSHQLAQAGAHIDRYYYCPHHPTEGQPPYRMECNCRKPKPGLLLQAAQDFDLELAQCYVVGDNRSDIELSQYLKCRAILVLTGHGAQVWQTWMNPFHPWQVVKDLSAAVDSILAEVHSATHQTDHA
jgi:D-glycero-D-manno-heptose 1,7-bisphosphate phosphatase